MTVEELPQRTDQDNPVPLGSHQVVNADTEQCLDSMLNNFHDVSINGGTGFGTGSLLQVKGRLKENNYKSGGVPFLGRLNEC